MPLLVPDVLLLAVSSEGGSVLLTVPSPVIRVARAPFLRTVLTNLAVFRVGSYLLSVINQRWGDVGSPSHCIPSASVDISIAGRIAHNSGNAVRSYWRLSHRSTRECQAGDLETAVE